MIVMIDEKFQIRFEVVLDYCPTKLQLGFEVAWGFLQAITMWLGGHQWYFDLIQYGKSIVG